MDDDRKQVLCERIVALVLADWRAAGGAGVGVDVLVDGGAVHLWLNGGGTNPAAWADDELPLFVEVAEHLQAELVDRASRVLPVCRVHRCGVHPQESSGTAVWWCRVGDHRHAVIGELAGSA